MGWTFTHAELKYNSCFVNRKLEMDVRLHGGYDRVLKSKMVGYTYYGAIETIKDNTRKVYAVICLTGEVNKVPQLRLNFAFKRIFETDNPPYYDCPKSILKLLTPTDDESANEWRQKCWDHVKAGRSKKIKSLNFGDRIICTERNGVERVLVKHEPDDRHRKWYWYDPESDTAFHRRRAREENTRLYTENETLELPQWM